MLGSVASEVSAALNLSHSSMYPVVFFRLVLIVTFTFYLALMLSVSSIVCDRFCSMTSSIIKQLSAGD